MRLALTLWFLPFILTCSAPVDNPQKVSRFDSEPTSSESNLDGGGSHGLCDKGQVVVINNRIFYVPVFCNPTADQVWDPPPDALDRRPETREVPYLSNPNYARVAR